MHASISICIILNSYNYDLYIVLNIVINLSKYKLAHINNRAVPFLSRAAANLCWYQCILIICYTSFSQL